MPGAISYPSREAFRQAAKRIGLFRVLSLPFDGSKKLGRTAISPAPRTAIFLRGCEDTTDRIRELARDMLKYGNTDTY